MLVNRTTPRVVHKPRRDAASVKPAEALEPRHRHPNRELFEADGALCVVDAVFLGCRVGVHAGPPGRRLHGLAASDTAAMSWTSVTTVRLNAGRDVRLA